MKLFTKEIDKQLFAQYSKGGDLENQKVVAKIFNPYGRGTWYIINSDPNDPDYLWAIVDLFEIEIGSVSRMDLESIKVPPFRLGLERDLYFTPVNAAKLYRDLIIKAEDELTGESEGERRAGMDEFKEGGEVESEGGENKEMLENQAHEIAHHSEELKKAIEKSDEIEPWVVAKVERAATDLSDVTHYLEGESKSEYKSGGVINRDLNLYVKSKAEKYAKELKPSFYKEVMAQAVVASLSDANFHKEARKLVMLLEGKEQWSDDLYQSLYYDANDDVFEFATEVSRKAEWSGDDIANAFIYAMKMTGLHSLAAQVEKAMKYAEGGKIEEYAEGGEVKWQEAERGDNALVVSENKLGLIIQAYGRKFHLRFPDGKEKTYDANELKFIKDIDDFDRGGQVKAKEYKIVPMIPYGVQGYLQQDYKNTIRFQGTEDEAIAKAKEIANSNPDFVRVEVKKESKTKTVTVGIVEGNSSKAKGGMMANSGEVNTRELNKKVKDWYIKKYPKDDLGKKINDKITFKSLWAYMSQGYDVYDVLEVGDSIVRERVFEKLSENLGVDYDVVYQKWLGRDNYKDGGEMMDEIKYRKRQKMFGYKPYGKTKGSFRIDYKIDGEQQSEVRLSLEEAQDVKKRYEKIGYTDVEITDVTKKMASGGKVKFADKVKSIKTSLLKRKKVSPSVQKDYGKTYSPKEAEESAKRIVGAMTAKERLMAKRKKSKK